jgi:hypothetical protein
MFFSCGGDGNGDYFRPKEQQKELLSSFPWENFLGESMMLYKARYFRS